MPFYPSNDEEMKVFWEVGYKIDRRVVGLYGSGDYSRTTEQKFDSMYNDMLDRDVRTDSEKKVLNIFRSKTTDRVGTFGRMSEYGIDFIYSTNRFLITTIGEYLNKKEEEYNNYTNVISKYINDNDMRFKNLELRLTTTQSELSAYKESVACFAVVVGLLMFVGYVVDKLFTKKSYAKASAIQNLTNIKIVDKWDKVMKAEQKQLIEEPSKIACPLYTYNSVFV